MASNKTTVMTWLKKLLRPYLEDRLRVLVATDAGEALSASSRAVEAPRKAASMPMRDPFQSNMPLALSRSTPAPATVLVSQPKRTKPKFDSNGYHEGGREERAGVGGPTPIHANGAAHGESRSSQGAARPGETSPATRFKRCYYVPVLNPLPDLKDKQLAVLDVRLYGIRDMPTFKEPAPMLPPSVIGTAKLRNLSLFRLHDMMEGLYAPPQLMGPEGAHAAPHVEEEEGEGELELREGEEAGSKGPAC